MTLSWPISYKLDLNNLVFNGGEEYEFVFTVPPNHKKIIIKNAKLLKIPIIEIGFVTSGKSQPEGPTILINNLRGRRFL